MQLVFSFPARRTLEPMEKASFQTTELYDPKQYPFNSHNRGHTGTYRAPPSTRLELTANAVCTGMQAAILEGLYNGTRQPFVSCPTGNCTWTEFTTLGVWATCGDVGNQTETQYPGRTEDNNRKYECNYSIPDYNVPLTGWIYSFGGSGILSGTR